MEKESKIDEILNEKMFDEGRVSGNKSIHYSS